MAAEAFEGAWVLTIATAVRQAGLSGAAISEPRGSIRQEI